MGPPHVFQIASCVTWMRETIPSTTLLSASALEGSMSYVGGVWGGTSCAGGCTVGGILHSSLLTPLALPAGLTPFLVKLLDDEDLTAKQALHLLDLQLREQVTAVSKGCMVGLRRLSNPTYVPHQRTPCCTARSSCFGACFKTSPVLGRSVPQQHVALCQTPLLHSSISCQTAKHLRVAFMLAFRFVLRTSTIFT